MPLLTEKKLNAAKNRIKSYINTHSKENLQGEELWNFILSVSHDTITKEGRFAHAHREQLRFQLYNYAQELIELKP